MYELTRRSRSGIPLSGFVLSREGVGVSLPMAGHLAVVGHGGPVVDVHHVALRARVSTAESQRGAGVSLAYTLARCSFAHRRGGGQSTLRGLNAPNLNGCAPGKRRVTFAQVARRARVDGTDLTDVFVTRASEVLGRTTGTKRSRCGCRSDGTSYAGSGWAEQSVG